MLSSQFVFVLSAIITLISAGYSHERALKHKNAFSSLRGPHITANFPDPCIIAHNGVSFAFATNNRKAGSDHINVQVATSHDNKTWSIEEGIDALPRVAMWQTGNAVWAPDVKHLPDGRFLLYYTDSLRHEPQTHCIGAAIATNVVGPYEPLEMPLICPRGGAIDPAGFMDRSTGKRYIVYKVDGNSLGHGGSCSNDVMPIVSTPLLLQEVDSTTGTKLIGSHTQILDRDALDGPLIEAPSMYLSFESIYFLFYSSNCFTSPMYATGYATATNITGPYKKAARPLLLTGDYQGLTGPGGMDILHSPYSSSNVVEHEELGGRLILFHGHMTVHNDPARQHGQEPIKDLHQDFIRGMYSGRAYFEGRTVSLHTRDRGEGEGQL